MTQDTIDRANAEFWNELCGSGLAKHIGITDHSLESLRRFDDTYFSFYPYLLPFIRPERMANKSVLEIGLGYGSLGQKLAEGRARYTGLDLAANAVKMMNHRLRLQGLGGQAVCGNSLTMPFPSASFDYVVSIGCFHHTGDVRRCLDETNRVLRPGGTALVMVYNKYSFREWVRWPGKTLKSWLHELRSGRDGRCVSEQQRKAYDANATGQAAPETVLLSKRELRAMLYPFEKVTVHKQNCDPLVVRGRILMRRESLLSTLGRVLGLDLYVEAKKPALPVGVLQAA